MQQVEVDSGGRIKLGPGALYGSIKQLRESGLIKEIKSNTQDRRRSYMLTDKGWQQLTNELDYYRTTINLARRRPAPESGL